MQNSSSAAQGQHPPHHANRYDPTHAVPPPEEPPPSYDDATHSATSPLLVGPPPDYGAFRAFVDPDASSEASSEVEEADQTLPERIGQVFGVLVFVAILYIFWRFITSPDPDNFFHRYATALAARP